MEAVGFVSSLVSLITVVLNKYESIQSLKEEVSYFRRVLFAVRSVLLDLRGQLEREPSRWVGYTPLTRPLELLEEGIVEGRDVIKECSEKKKIKARVFSRTYLGKLNKAASKIRDAMQMIATAGVSIQGSINEKVDALAHKIEHHNHEVADMINEHIDTGMQSLPKRIVSVMVDAGLVVTQQDLDSQLREIAKQAEDLRKEKAFAEEQILQYVQGLSMMERGSPTPPPKRSFAVYIRRPGGQSDLLDHYFDTKTTTEEFRAVVADKWDNDFYPSRSFCSFECRRVRCSSYRLDSLLYGDKTLYEALRLCSLTFDPIILEFRNYCDCPHSDTCRSLIQSSECCDDAFKRERRLGFGSSGDVHAVVHKATKKGGLALKVVRCRSTQERREILLNYEAFTQIDDVRIVPFFAVFEIGSDDVGILMPQYRGTMLDEIKAGKVFSAREIFCVAQNVLQGLVCLEKHKVVHRDLKPSNIFLAPSHESAVDYYLLGDMEAAAIIRGSRIEASGGTGTYAHLAPEQILDVSTHKSDIWALGCTLHWLIVGRAVPTVMHLAAYRDGAGFSRAIDTQLDGTTAGGQYPELRRLIQTERTSVPRNRRDIGKTQRAAPARLYMLPAIENTLHDWIH